MTDQTPPGQTTDQDPTSGNAVREQPTGDRRRYRLDSSFRQHGSVVIGGSPLKLFRLTDGGAAVVTRIAAGDHVAGSALTASLLDAGAIHPRPDPAHFTADDVTIVVPSLGNPHHVPEGAILVDDGSEPPIAGATVRLEVNQGPGAARNAGLELVTTEFVAFVDADVELTDGWLDPLLAHFCDDQVAMVAPRVRTRRDLTLLGRYEHEHGPLDLGPEPARIRAGSRVSYVPAAAIVCRTEAIRAIGGFEPALRFGEDVDLVWRLIDSGRVCRYEPASEVYHAIRPDRAAWIRQRIDYGSSAAALARRHRRALAPIRMSGWSLGSWLLVFLGRPVLGCAVGVGSAAALARKLPDLPAAAMIHLAGLGNLHAGGQIAAAVRRVWWPLLVLAAMRSRSARRLLLASAIAARHPLALVDDVAYSLGVWKGMWTERTLDPLIPEVSSWPGRSTPSPTSIAR